MIMKEKKDSRINQADEQNKKKKDVITRSSFLLPFLPDFALFDIIAKKKTVLFLRVCVWISMCVCFFPPILTW